MYLATSDCAATEAAALKAGGTAIVPTSPMDPWGTMAILADPAGTVTALWQAGTHVGSGRYNEPGAPCWAEVSSPDPAATRAFLSAIFGYGEDAMPGMDYTAETLGGEAVFGVLGGLGRVEQGHGAWMVYFAVDDADAATAKAGELGGTVLEEPQDSPFGRIGAVADPFGAHFMVIDQSRRVGAT
ncbi:MAG: VOC family protein [Streptosporangiales bacterium]|nr:VOC family protein [Streptosporangiales bacterium]